MVGAKYVDVVLEVFLHYAWPVLMGESGSRPNSTHVSLNIWTGCLGGLVHQFAKCVWCVQQLGNLAGDDMHN